MFFLTELACVKICISFLQYNVYIGVLISEFKLTALMLHFRQDHALLIIPKSFKIFTVYSLHLYLLHRLTDLVYIILQMTRCVG